MPTPFNAYRKGYEEGRTDNLAGNVTEAVLGMLKDDPGGYRAAGYRDGSGRRKFNPPPKDPLNSSGKKDDEFNPIDDKVSIKTVCPNCGAIDWFEWKFLGRLTDPVCSYTWFAGSGTYALMQFRAAFGAGRRFSKSLTSGVSGEGAWIGKAFGWFLGIMLGMGVRLEIGILMIPIQAIVGLCHSSRSTSGIASRSAVLILSMLALGFAVYELNSGAQPGAPLRAGIVPLSQTSAVLQSVSSNGGPDYTSDWAIASHSGSPTMTYSAGTFQIQAPAVCPAPNTGTVIGLRSKARFVGDLDVSFQLNHGGFGRTSVYLWSEGLNQPAMGADLDTDDTNYLNLTSGQNSTQYRYSSTPYLNTMVTLRIQVAGTEVKFYVDRGSGQELLQTYPVPVVSPPDTYSITFSVGSICWKSGPNVTSIRLIQAIGTRAN